MEENNILIFEDEWNSIKGSFELANTYAFNGRLKYVQKPKSQDVDITSLGDKYKAVFVDITLAKNTEMDGFNIIKEIRNRHLIDLKRVIVMTGNSKVEEKFKNMGIDTNELTILYKPIDFLSLSDVLKKIL